MTGELVQKRAGKKTAQISCFFTCSCSRWWRPWPGYSLICLAPLVPDNPIKDKQDFADPHWFNADPDLDPAFFLIAAPDPDPVLDPGFWWTKIGKKFKAEKKIFFWSKIASYLSLGLYKGRPSYRRSLQPSKENIQQFKTWHFFTFFLFLWVIFVPLDPDPDPHIESRSRSSNSN